MASTWVDTSFGISTVIETCSAAVESFLPEANGPAILAVVSLENVQWIAGQHGLRAREAATQEFGSRLHQLIRQGDGYFRVSDDHICLVFLDLIDRNHGILAAKKLESLFASPLALEGTQIPLIIRAGLLISPVVHPSVRRISFIGL